MKPHRKNRSRRQKLVLSNYTFTAFFAPVWGPEYVGQARRSGKRLVRQARNPLRRIGYQVTVPALPGVITYGRTLDEARKMARDAVQCHLDGLRKACELIPGEAEAHTEKLRVSLAV